MTLANLRRTKELGPEKAWKRASGARLACHIPGLLYFWILISRFCGYACFSVVFNRATRAGEYNGSLGSRLPMGSSPVSYTHLPPIQARGVERAYAETASIPWYVWCCVLSALSAVVGSAWDISWHETVGRDTFWTPAHMMIYLSGVLAGIDVYKRQVPR